MSSLNSHIDNVFCINLKRRKDRWERMRQIFIDNNMSVQKWNAVDGKFLSKNEYITHGQIGCLRSHRGVLEESIKKNYAKICILEDDIILQKNFDVKFTHLMESVPNDWDMIYLGCHFWGLSDPIITDKNFCKIDKCYGIYSVIMKNTVFTRLLEVSKEEKQPMDAYIADIQPEFNVYCSMPFLVKVVPDFSDIAEVFEAYDITGKYYDNV